MDKTNDMKSFADLPQKCKHAFIEFWKSYYMENVTVRQNTQIWLSCKNDSILQSIHTNWTDNGVHVKVHELIVMNMWIWFQFCFYDWKSKRFNNSRYCVLYRNLLIKFRFSLNTNFDAGWVLTRTMKTIDIFHWEKCI